MCVSVCLPTNTLSSPFPPSLAPSLEFSSIQSSPVHHKLRATLLSPISPSLPPPFRNQRLRNCGLLFQKSALRCNRRPVTTAASGFAYHYLQHHAVRTQSYLDTLRLQKRGASQTASSGLETRLSRHLPDCDLRRLEAGHRPFTAPSYCFRRRHWIYTLFFFTHTHSPLRVSLVR